MIETEIKVTPQIAAEHGLSPEEYARTQKILGRDPSFTELGIFSVMWSEHCSYKSSRVHLKRLPTRGTHVVQGPGENAGVVDIGDGMVAVFKIESHNHPSFVEPFQGAATGVGGILRDIFTMGARPIAVMDSLRFGPITSGPGAGNATPEENARNRHILDGVIRGIGFYGNCFGVPTVGGEVVFEPCYANNPLVNALALGICRREELFFAKARGAGNPVIYVGAKTGRDGIHGASLLASAEFSEESQQKRPNVQMGDPFMEKLLLEACLEAMRTGAVVAIQDMGAAGLTSSSSEMASRGGLGIEIDLARVPQRETGMTPYEIMLSESQERMLLVAERGREREVFDVFHKWGLDAVEIGRVTEDGILRVLNHGEVAAAIPAHAIAEEGPRYERPIAAPDAKAVEAERLMRNVCAFGCGGRGFEWEFFAFAGVAYDCFEALDHRAIRFDGADEYDVWSWGRGCGGAAVERIETCFGAGDRRKRALGIFGAAIGRNACGGGSGAECGLQRGASYCGYELFEFWEPGKAGSNVAIQRGD